MGIQAQIDRIKNNVTRSLAKVAEKGVTVPADANSDDLEGLIDAITGGGGLPDGVSALASGTIMLSSQSLSMGFYNIEHGLEKGGVKIVPNFYIIAIKGTVSPSDHAGFLCLALNAMMNFGNSGTKGLVYTVTSSNGLTSYSSDFQSGTNSVIYNDTSFAVFLNNRPLKASTEYIWICGVIDGLV